MKRECTARRTFGDKAIVAAFSGRLCNGQGELVGLLILSHYDAILGSSRGIKLCEYLRCMYAHVEFWAHAAE